MLSKIKQSINLIYSKSLSIFYTYFIYPFISYYLRDSQIGKLNMWRRWDLSWKGTISVLQEKAVKESVEFIESQTSNKYLLFFWREQLWNYAIKRALNNKHKGIWAEFGVNNGLSINYFARAINNSRQIYGFDSFEGLSEDWTSWTYPEGTFDKKSNFPKVAKNVTLIKGWIDESLPKFIQENLSEIKEKGFSFIHIDVDTYSPTKTILSELLEFMNEGCIIIFDDFYGYNGWKNHEYRAYQEVFIENKNNKENFSLEFIGFCNRFQVACSLKKIRKH